MKMTKPLKSQHQTKKEYDHKVNTNNQNWRFALRAGVRREKSVHVADDHGIGANRVIVKHAGSHAKANKGMSETMELLPISSKNKHRFLCTRICTASSEIHEEEPRSI